MAAKKSKRISIKQLSKIQQELKPNLAAPYLKVILDTAERNPDYLLHRSQEMLKEADLVTESEKRVLLLRATQLLILAIARTDLMLPTAPPLETATKAEYYTPEQKDEINDECKKVRTYLTAIRGDLIASKEKGFAVDGKLGQVDCLLDETRFVWTCTHVWNEDGAQIKCNSCNAEHRKDAPLNQKALQTLGVPLDYKTRFKQS